MIKVLGKDEYLKYTNLFRSMQSSIEGIHYTIDCPWVYDNIKISENDVILDVGCGHGGLGLYIAKEKKCKLYGLDKDDYHNVFDEKCKKYGILNARFVHEDAENMSCPNEFFDTVISISALEHCSLEHINRSVKQIARVLKNRRRLAATVAIIFENYYIHHNEYRDFPFPFKSEKDIIYAFTNDTGMRLVDDVHITGWNMQSREIIDIYKEYSMIIGSCTWLPVGVIVEKR